MNTSRTAICGAAPSIPILPQLLLPFGALPLPTRYRIYFGEPMRFEGHGDEEDEAIEHQVEDVRAAVQKLIERGLGERKGVFS